MTDVLEPTVTNSSGAHADLSRFHPYPAYKDSGVEWLGEVPVGWTAPALYTRYSIELGKMLNEGRITGDSLLPYLRNIDVQWDRINFVDLPEMDISPSEAIRYTVRTGDILVCEGGDVGRAAIVPSNIRTCAYQKALHRMRPLGGHEVPRFMFYTLFWAALKGIFIAEGNSNTIPHLTGEKLRRYRFLKPSYDEQLAIASFLDRETAKIDALIAAKERFLELLEEQRSAVISHAVTKGLDPNVPMKDSGVEWIGEIPAHWEAILFSRAIRERCDGPFGSDMKSNHYVDEGVRLIRLQNIGSGEFNDSDKAFISESHFESLPGHEAYPGDLLVAGLGDANHPAGRACLLPNDITRAMVKADCFRLRLEQNFLQHAYAMYYLCSKVARAGINLQLRGATRDRINLSGISRLPIIVPPLKEQKVLVDFISAQIQQSGLIKQKVESAITTLREYRTALISAAVTGKIDLRGEAMA